MIVKRVKYCPLNNYFIFDLSVKQSTVNKIFHCFSSVYSVWSRLLLVYVRVRVGVNLSSKTPGALSVTGAHDKLLRHVHSYRRHNLCGAFIAGLI